MFWSKSNFQKHFRSLWWIFSRHNYCEIAVGNKDGDLIVGLVFEKDNETQEDSEIAEIRDKVMKFMSTDENWRAAQKSAKDPRKYIMRKFEITHSVQNLCNLGECLFPQL